MSGAHQLVWLDWLAESPPDQEVDDESDAGLLGAENVAGLFDSPRRLACCAAAVMRAPATVVKRSGPAVLTPAFGNCEERRMASAVSRQRRSASS